MNRGNNRCKFVLIFSLLFCFSVSVASDDTWDTSDPRGVLKQGRSLALQGEHDKALKRYEWVREWYFRADHSKSPSDSVLHDFVVMYWGELSKTYPKAREALTAIRDQDEKALLQGKDSLKLVTEVLRINYYLNQEGKSVDLFKAIHKGFPNLAAGYYYFFEHSLVQAREYQLCATYVQDGTAAFGRICDYRQVDVKLARETESLEEKKKIETDAETAFIQRVAQLVEILAGSGHMENAKQIQKQAIAVKDTSKLREAIQEAINRATK